MNLVIFLDYYHPYAGLCNQLYLITNHINEAYQKDTKIYINKVNIDIFNKERIPAADFFDLKATNENIKRLTGKDLILFEKPNTNFVIPNLCIYPVTSIPILNCLEFNKTILDKIPKFETNIYGLHLRIDIDCIIHYLFEVNIYNNFMKMNLIEKTNFINKLLLDQRVKDYIFNLLSQYITFIKKVGFDKPWYICTSVGKNMIHAPLFFYLKYILEFIKKNGGTYILPEEYFKQRDLNALIDLLVLRDCEKMVGFSGSSFSEGYCLKVNLIRNNIKESYFVDGIVPKLNLNGN